MECDKYKVLIDETTIAENMGIETALILVKALFEEYYNDHSMKIIIKRMEETDEESEEK